MMLDIPSTGAEGACQIGFRDMEGLCHLGGSGTPRPRFRVRDAFRGFLPRNLGADLLCPVCLQGPFATGTDGPCPFVFFTPECPFAHVNVLGSAQCPFVRYL